MLKTKDMYDRLVKGGFTDQQAEALIVVIEELAEVFVTKEYLEAELRKHTLRLVFWLTGIMVATQSIAVAILLAALG